MKLNAEQLANILAVLHKDMITVKEAVSSAAADVAHNRSTMKAAKAHWLTDSVEDVALRLERMVRRAAISDIGIKVYQEAMEIVNAFLYQRHNCRTLAAFTAQGEAMTKITEGGVFQILIAKRKAAKAQAQAEAVQTAPSVEQLETELVELEARRAELTTIMQDDSTSDADFDAANAEAVTVGKAMMQTRSNIAIARNAEIVAAKKEKAAEPVKSFTLAFTHQPEGASRFERVTKQATVQAVTVFAALQQITETHSGVNLGSVELISVEPSTITVSFRGLPFSHTATHTAEHNNLLEVWNGGEFVTAYPLHMAEVVSQAPCLTIQ